MSTSATSHAARSARRRRGRRLVYHHGDLRRALLQAALDLVRLRGPEGFTLREAARRVGVSQTAPYRHFETKEALLAAVAEEGFHALHHRLVEAAASAGADPLERLRAQGIASFEFYVSEPARFRVMFARASSRKERFPGLAGAWHRVDELLLASLVACQRAGHVRDGDPLELGLAIAAMTHGLAALAVEGHLGEDLPKNRAAVRELFRRARTVLYEGLRPPDRPASPRGGAPGERRGRDGGGAPLRRR